MWKRLVLIKCPSKPMETKQTGTKSASIYKVRRCSRCFTSSSRESKMLATVARGCGMTAALRQSESQV